MIRNLLTGFVVIGCLLLISCLKQEDKTGEGPKTNILLVNAALDAAPVNFLLSGEPLLPEDIAFGEAGYVNDNGYVRTRPGLHTAGWRIGGENIINDKFIMWKPNAYFTVLHFDTAVGGLGSWTIIEDKPVVTDTSARARFINCIAGLDTLSLRLIRGDDTVQVASRRPYLEASGITGTEYSANVLPGTWRYELINKNNLILEAADYQIQQGELYSFIGIGESGSSGEKQPRVLPVRQKK